MLLSPLSKLVVLKETLAGLFSEREKFRLLYERTAFICGFVGGVRKRTTMLFRVRKIVRATIEPACLRFYSSRLVRRSQRSQRNAYHWTSVMRDV